MTNNIQIKRALKASFVLLVFIACIPLSGKAQESAQSLINISALTKPLVEQVFSSVESAGSSNETNLDSGENQQETLNNIESSQGVNSVVNSMGIDTQNEVSEAFISECINVENCENLIVSSGEEIISFTTHECASETFSNIAQDLTSKGWTHAKSGVEHQGTFIKSEGDIRWLYISALQYGEGSCVVIQKS